MQCLHLAVLANVCAAGPVHALEVSAEPIEAIVVDDAGKPVDDVAVLARWQLQTGMEGGHPRELMLLETVSGADGRFSFPAWGPKRVPFLAMLASRDPALYLFKSGYRFLALYNRTDVSTERTNRPVRRSEWNGKTITLPRVVDVRAHALEIDVGPAADMRAIVTDAPDCEWKELPILLSRLDQERQRLQALGLPTSLPAPAQYGNQDRCGSAVEWLRQVRR